MWYAFVKNDTWQREVLIYYSLVADIASWVGIKFTFSIWNIDELANTILERSSTDKERRSIFLMKHRRSLEVVLKR